jgi:hypothetical protein
MVFMALHGLGQKKWGQLPWLAGNFNVDGPGDGEFAVHLQRDQWITAKFPSEGAGNLTAISRDF